MVKRYVPNRGDLIQISFDPTRGREQQGQRPAFVISPRSYSAKSSLALVMPVTRQQKGYPFEVSLPPTALLEGVILVDQIRSLDWKARHVRFVETAPESVLAEVHAKLAVLIGVVD